MPQWPKGTQVQVYCGAGWSKGSVQHSSADAVSVWLGREQRTSVCKDARNIRRADS